MIGAFVAALSRLFSTQVGRWIVSAMLFLGLQWVSQKTIGPAFVSAVGGYFSSVDSTLAAWLGMLRLDQYISIYLSAYVTRASMQGARAVLTKRAG